VRRTCGQFASRIYLGGDERLDEWGFLLVPVGDALGMQKPVAGSGMPHANSARRSFSMMTAPASRSLRIPVALLRVPQAGSNALLLAVVGIDRSDDVLEAERHTVKRAAVDTARKLSVGELSFAEPRIVGDRNEGRDSGLARVGAFEKDLRQA
jgi:hypothetical protein